MAPESQRMFPKFANVPLSELSKNIDFLDQAYTCISAFNTFVKYYNRSTSCPNKCPVLSKIHKKYSESDVQVQYELIFYTQIACCLIRKCFLCVQKLKTVWMTTVKEELGNDFNDEIKDSWERVLKAIGLYVTA